MVTIKFILLIICSYLLGSISVARMITSRKNKNNDITTQGSGNPGTMNMLRNHGVVLGFTTLICDALKGAIPAIIGAFVLFPESEILSIIALYASGLAAVIGHMFSIFYGFKGGKGIATTFGVFMVANPLLGVILFVIDFVLFYFIKIGSVASMLFIVPFGIINTFISDVSSSYTAMILMWLIIIFDVFAHKQNFIRLFANEERLTSFKEGVKKDIERVKQRKKNKLAEINEYYDEKHTKQEEKYNKKLEKSILKAKKKKEKLKRKYNNIINELQQDSDETIKYMQYKIDLKKQKEREKTENSNEEDPNM